MEKEKEDGKKKKKKEEEKRFLSMPRMEKATTRLRPASLASSGSYALSG